MVEPNSYWIESESCKLEFIIDNSMADGFLSNCLNDKFDKPFKADIKFLVRQVIDLGKCGATFKNNKSKCNIDFYFAVKEELEIEKSR